MSQNNTNYMTSGQLAREAGVTLRTLRFYDQKGILVPAKRGIGNTRFYSPEDRDRLYEILCYKFMGMSLDEIREMLEQHREPKDISQILQQKVRETEEDVSGQMLRFAVIKDLKSLFEAGHEVQNWTAYAALIEYIQAKWDMIWQLNQMMLSDRMALSDQMTLGDLDDACEPNGNSEEMKRYFRLMTEVLQKMEQEVSPESEEMMELVGRYFAMQPNELLNKVDPEFMKVRSDRISDYWEEINAYMKKAIDHYRESRMKDENDK